MDGVQIIQADILVCGGFGRGDKSVAHEVSNLHGDIVATAKER
jgi:hypothetical protein